MRLQGRWPILKALLWIAIATSVALPSRGQSAVQPAASGAAAVPKSPYEGQTVQAIRFPDVVTVADQQRFAKLVVQQPGQPLDHRKVRQSLQALYATGRFADLRVEADPAPGGVDLLFRTSPNYFIGEVIVEDNPSQPSASQIVNASKLNLGELFSREKMDSALSSIRQLLQQNGYYQAKVTDVEKEYAPNQQVRIELQVVPGARAHVGLVSVIGNESYSSLQIQEISRLRPGQVITGDRVTGALTRLRKKFQKQDRWLTQVRIVSQVYHPDSNTVDYSFDVTPGPRVKVQLEGFKLSKGRVKKLIPVFQESALDNDLLNEGRRNLLNYLQDRGYFEATVDYRRRRPNADNDLVVVYRINAGEIHKLVNIAFAGNQYFTNELLRSHMQIQTAERLLSHGRFSQKLLNDDVSILENLYRLNGFRDVAITPKVEDDYAGRHDEVAVTLNIEEGAQTRVGSVRLVGNTAVSEDVLQARLNTVEGQPFAESNISQDRDSILNYYFNRGYPDATFEASAQPTPGVANSMDVTYNIHEGNLVSVNQIILSGLQHTKPFVVTREIQMKPDDALSQLDLLSTQQRLYDLGIFSQVDTSVQNPDGEEQEKNVLINIKEARRYTFNYGFGLEFQTGQPSSNQAQGATGVSPRLSFGVTRLNFRGRNHTVSFKGNVGRLQQRGLVSYEAPRWQNSPDLKLSFSIGYDKTVDVSTFTSERFEGSAQVEQILTHTANGSPLSILDYRFTYRRVQATNLPTNISLVLLPLLSQPARVGAPGFSFIRDKRDNPVDPAKGNYTTIDGSVASQYFGSERDFGRVLIQNSTYYAFGKNRQRERKFVFARSTRVGVESPFAGTVYVRPGQSSTAPTIPLPELFLAGGGNTHRGFGLNQAGPRDPDSGFPLGGSALFVNNLELRLPPMTLPYLQDNLSLALFHDAGNVFISGHDMLHNLLRWQQKNPQLCLQDSTAVQCDYSYVSHAIGVGVRYKTPIGPVRFDFGYNLNPPAFPSCQATADPSNPTPSSRCMTRDPNSPFFVPQHARRFNVFFSIGQTF